MVYRKTTLEDCRAVYDLICNMENKKLPYDKFEKIYHNQINDFNYYCLVCEHEDMVIGALNMRFEDQLHHSERIAEILEFAVATAYRNMGIGKEMLSQSCQIAKDNGCSQIEVDCNQLRKDTHRFYIREGMHNFHFKFSKQLIGDNVQENALCR
ncbi:GNAT family acetyltransferase [Clostridium carboxidivorans P7]|uniref:GCN5-related N-acetyltransferase n=1 Tax=Clostridium carboxidivorans P7 TaxID=536227 RepID=C6PU60_9CLOT|nr:GNAT family N-acetyltransferase [Clostridium carboxidivorans]AKN33821.1 GNAT family acetyltransferase [Clostridium carboxidivorans P7]EET87260.1 GCN5-related N-acetyltransferase [Clostridium carboxidivorans P7]EFG86566.1 acetyltransferase, GNAT family [Clostridium carboxidivorans P7]